MNRYALLSAVLLSASSFKVIAETSANFGVSANLTQGCLMGTVSQSMKFPDQPSHTQTKVETSIANTAQTWNIRCSTAMPVRVRINMGQNGIDNRRRLKHSSQDHYIHYELFQDAAKTKPYPGGQPVDVKPTTAQNNVLEFSIFAVADLNNNSAPRPSGIYKESFAITVIW